jgi:hypothetical protein
MSLAEEESVAQYALVENKANRSVPLGSIESRFAFFFGRNATDS